MDVSLQQLLTHAVGFLITVWILKKYAWGPLLAIMEERRAKISSEFKTIEEEKAKAAQLTAEYEARLHDIDAERRTKLVEAVEEGKKIAQQIESDARNKAKDIQTKARADIEIDIAKAKVQLKDEMVTITMAAAEKILHEKLDDARDRELIGRFIENVEKA